MENCFYIKALFNNDASCVMQKKKIVLLSNLEKPPPGDSLLQCLRKHFAFLLPNLGVFMRICRP